MNTEQQKQFKDLALKYAKSFAENDFSKEVIYDFKLGSHKMIIYFYCEDNWNIKFQYNGDWQKEVEYSHTSFREIGFSLELKEKEINEMISELKHHYKVWLLDLETKKQAKHDLELEEARDRLARLEAMQ